MAFNLSNAKFKLEKCTDPDHNHEGHWIETAAIKYKGRLVEVTRDGIKHHARVDGGLPILNADINSMIEFVESEVSKQRR